ASSARARHRPEGAGGARTSGSGRDKTPRLATGVPSSKFQDSRRQPLDQGTRNLELLRGLLRADSERSLGGRHAEVRASAIDGARGTVAPAAAPRVAHDGEVRFDIAVAAAVGVELEAAVPRHLQLDRPLVGFESASVRVAGELDAGVSLMRLD